MMQILGAFVLLFLVGAAIVALAVVIAWLGVTFGMGAAALLLIAVGVVAALITLAWPRRGGHDG